MIFCFYLLIEQQKSQKSVSKTLRLKFKAKAGAKVAWDLQNLVFVGKNYYECQCFRCVSGWAAPWWRRRTLRRCRGRRGRWRRTVPTTWRAWSRPRRWIDKAEYVEWGKTGRTWMRSTQTDQWPWYTPAELYRRNQSSKTLKRLSLSLQSWKLINAALSSYNPRYRVTVLLVKPNFCLFASDYILKIYLSRK